MVLFYQFIIFCACASGFYAKKAYPNQPKLYVTDGHLHIQMPENKYIQFYTSSFHVNDQELLTTLKGATKATKMVQTYERFISQYHSKMDDIENRLLNLGMSSTGINISTSTNTTLQNQNTLNKFRGIYRRLSVMQRAIASLQTLLIKDDCASNPCKNGGMCLDMFNGFLCQCQSGWEGLTCEKDIDECARLKGTDLDCQNGGVCQNLPGSYQCYCQKPWVGIHCTRKVIDCNSGSSEICGHGTCVPQNNEVGYKCICDAGWTTDGTHNACSVDVDECKLNHPPCSTNPLVLCTNVPGSFVCQHCPPGYTGNGYYCADINECELFNGGCSVSPQVECINTQGSSKCGPCPPGYQGDGKTCTYKGICNVNNGGCNLLARCVDNPAISDAFVQCLCPSGYTGSGIGPNGCTKINYSTSTCPFNPCVNGVCVPNNSTQGFYCQCDANHIGPFCQREINPCATNPCLNGGTCQRRRGKSVCLCPSGFTGRLCNQERQGCGENIYLSNGTLSYPPNDFSSSRGSQAVSCAWTIRTDESMVIQINFTKFNVPSDGSCSSQWFQIHDGKNSLAPPLGRYCGTTLPLNGSVTSTHNVVYFWLRSSAQSQRPEFQITWLAKKPDCGGSISGGSGMIVSPGWPSNYPNNRDCYWHYKLPISKRLLFHVYALNIGHDSNCTGDFLKFYSSSSIFDHYNFQYLHGRGTTNELFAYFCNSTVPDLFYSTSYQGYIHFKSNEKDTYKGFQIGYSTVDGIPGCGGIYTNKDGYIQSLEMTNSMPSPLTCAYEIKLPLNLTIKMEIVEMDLDESCDMSNIAIFQGLSTDSGLIGKYCGSSLPGPIITFGNSVLIQSLSRRFHKNHWKIRYEAVCNQRFTDPEKTIVPASDLSGICTYHIEQPVGNIILLDLELTGLFFSMERCVIYYVEVRDGDNENSTLIGRYCKTGVKINIESSTNYLWITARIHPRASFTARYRALDMGCGGLLKKELGTISFPPSGSGKYSGNKKCRWVIMAPNDKVIQLTWMTFNLEQSFECTYDHIEVFDNNTDNSLGGSMGRFCGYTLPPLMLSSSNVMTIDFFSDTSVHGDGFLASYTFIKQNQVCGGNYFTSAGVIRTPRYPKNYPTNRECIWIITVPPGNQIMLNVTDFLVEAYSSCRYDWLEIRNGGTSSSPLIGRFCGNTIPKLIPSHANKLYLKFNSDMSRTTRGFKIQWSSAATGCGGALTSPFGSIMSPHYPEPYTRNTDCLWKITISAGSKIQIIFADIDLEKHSMCGLDFVQLLDGPTINSRSLGKFCSPQTNPVISTGNTMLVRFRSDVSFQGRGFNIQYSTLCKNTLTGFAGVIESPNFPNDYPQDQNCVWDIIVTEKNKINITFSHFALERSTTFENKSCSFDYVEIEYQTEVAYYDPTEQPQFEKFGRYCGYTNPGLITVNSHHAKIHFVSDSLLLGTGFRLEWRLFGCGGVLDDKEGVITSPNYPKPYPTGIECNWIITVPLGQSISITFNKLQVEKDSTCTYDFVKIYNGKDSSYPVLSTLCYQLKPTTITSTGNNMFIQFKADTSYQGPGFMARYKTEPTGCGGLLTATSGYIYSPNYPKNYNKNETCEWSINTDEHHKVELEFEDVNLLPVTNCNSTYIKIYDGPNQAYPLLETICGSIKPNKTIKSTYEHLFVEFRTDNFLTSKGFKAKYQKGCGATIKTSGNGNLKLDNNFLSTQTENGPCTYTIQAEDTSQHVKLTITFLANNGWCTDYDDSDHPLKIYNGPFSDSPLIGSYCGSKIPPTIISDGSALHMEITQGIDLFATYSVLDDQCGGELESQEGFLTTPGWPKTYPNNIQCTWIISLGPGNKINLNFLNFDIPESEHCNTDFLEIRETNETGKLLGVYCGLNKPTNLTANGKIYILFKSGALEEGASTAKKGFEAEYSLGHESQLSGPEGLIGNPHYPRHILEYGSFSWLITTKPKTRIEITFLDFIMESGFDDDCIDTPFKIYDGMDSEAKSLLQSCSSDLPAPIVTSSNMAYISLEAYSTRLESKFLLKWKELTVTKKSGASNSSACQFIYTLDKDTNRTITSPGYPNGYAPNLNCEWIFQTPEQYHIMVGFTEKNFGLWASYKVCTLADVIRVYQKPNKNGNWEILKEYCTNSNDYDEVIGTNMVKVEFKTNKYLNGTGFKAKVLKMCGGTLTEPSGYIFYNKTSHMDQECQWNISVRPSRTIKLSFEMFDLNPIASTDCKNYIMIRNGKFPDSPLLGNGKFCGPEMPSDMESTSNHLYLKYIGRSLGKGFKVNYEEVSIECGQYYQLSLEKPFVEITSPNYPNIPPVHIECVWTIRAPTGEALRVDFEERFDISESPRCDKDYLELRDGGTELSPLLGTYCVEAPSTQFTTDNMLRMKFFTDSDESRNGFKAKVSISYCGGTIRGTGGSLSTNEPHQIQAGSNCTWYLKVPLNYYISIKFLTLNLGNSGANCSRSSVSKVHLFEPRNSLFGNGTDLGTFCGTMNITEPIQSSNNEVIVNYLPKSDKAEFSLRFRAMKQTCGGNIKQDSGTITSPGYPNIIYEDRYCFWRIQVPKGRRISFFIDDADFDNTYIAILQGYLDGPKLAYQHEIKAGETYETSDNAAHILFWQQVQSNKRGFKMTFNSNKPTICVGNFNDSSGVIEALSINTSYRCEWQHIRKSPEETFSVKVKMETNDTRLGTLCRRTSTGVFVFNSNNDYLARLCRSSNNNMFDIRSPFAVTNLVTRRNIRAHLNYTIVFSTYQCGGIIENEEGQISSPNFPKSPKSNMECSWLIKLASEQRIKINVTDLNLGNDCDRSYLIIYNGNNPFYPRIGRYCKDTKPDIIITQKNMALIEYKYEKVSDESAKGFSLKYEPEIHGCGGVFQHIHDIIQTPGYSTDYPNNAECLWEIHAQDGYLIKLQFINRFHIEESEDCAKDYVEIFDWKDEEWVSLGKKCGRAPPQEITSTSTRLRVLFRSNDKITGNGFRATWDWHCGGTLEATKNERYLVSPGYPDIKKADCTYDIITKNVRGVVVIRFLDFNLGKDVECTQSNVTIGGSGRVLGGFIRNSTYCGINKPPNQRFYRSVRISFKNSVNFWFDLKGFKLAYKDDTCGGNITSPTSIEAPSTYHDVMQIRGFTRYTQAPISCAWFITAPSNQIPVLSITHLRMSTVLSCLGQQLEVFSSLTPNYSQKLATICGSFEENKPIISSSNTMMVKLVALPHNFGGFQGEIYFTYGPSAGCGGKINLTETKYINAPNNLPNMDCHWIIIAPEDYKVQIEFTKIHISGACEKPVRNHTYFCTCSFIEVRDGGGPFADQMSKLCSSDNNSPRTFTTSWNTAYIRLYSAVAQNDMFSVTLKPIQTKCGPSELKTVTTGTLELTSPDYPNSYPSEIKCTWRIRNPGKRGRLFLQFEDFDLLNETFHGRNSSSCDSDYLRISNDPNEHIVTQGYGPLAQYNTQRLLYAETYYQTTLCGTDVKPFNFYSSGSTVSVTFESSPTGKKGRGFKLKYGPLGCNRTIEANEGSVRAEHNDLYDCIITITAGKNRTISIYFTSFYSVNAQQTCANSGLEILEYNSTGTELLKTCGFRKPNPVFSSTNQLYLRVYNKRRNFLSSSFKFLFVSSDSGKGCGGKLFDFKGAFTSPMYPNAYRQDIECTWEVTVPKGYKVALRFTEFDISGVCLKNKLVVTTHNSNYPTTHQFCSEDAPAMLYSDFNLQVKYYSSVNNGGSGWSAQFQAVKEEADDLVWF